LVLLRVQIGGANTIGSRFRAARLAMPTATWTNPPRPAPLSSTALISNGGSPALWVKDRRLATVPSSAWRNRALAKHPICSGSTFTPALPPPAV
jgi:hypothetical protein